MITLTPDDVKKWFGLLFSKKFLVMVDECAGIAEIIEQCHARGTIEWDAMNRWRFGGVVTGCVVEGNAMAIYAKIGRFPAQFGAAADTIGGQALEAAGLYGKSL